MLGPIGGHHFGLIEGRFRENKHGQVALGLQLALIQINLLHIRYRCYVM